MTDETTPAPQPVPSTDSPVTEQPPASEQENGPASVYGVIMSAARDELRHVLNGDVAAAAAERIARKAAPLVTEPIRVALAGVLDAVGGKSGRARPKPSAAPQTASVGTSATGTVQERRPRGRPRKNPPAAASEAPAASSAAPAETPPPAPAEPSPYDL